MQQKAVKGMDIDVDVEIDVKESEKNYQNHLEVHLRYMILQLHYEKGTLILATLRALQEQGAGC